MEGIAFSVLFGSAAAGRLTLESDIDIGVYFLPTDVPGTPGLFAIEEPGAGSDIESELLSHLERTTGKTVDLVILNRAAASVGAEAVRTGIVLSMRRPDVFRHYQLVASDLAEDFRGYVEDFIAIRERSGSL